MSLNPHQLIEASAASRPLALPRWLVEDDAEVSDGRAWKAQGGQRRRLIIVSNRGPIEYSVNAQTGKIEARQGAGGVVSGLLSALKDRPVTWIALAMSKADREVAQANHGAIEAPDALPGLHKLDLKVCLVDAPERAYKRYYDGISNRVLWFTQHYLLKQTSRRLFTQRTIDDWEKGYRVVNEAVAEAVIAELDAQGGESPILFQDYHLYLAPAIVRQRRPEARLAHFTHIPWPEARYWELLPEEMTQEIYRGLAANDVVGFQTMSDARNFLAGAERFLPGARVLSAYGSQAGEIRFEGRRILVKVYPIAVTPSEVRASAAAHISHESAQLIRQARGPKGDRQIILRVDRIEPTKNIPQGFSAYERMLTEHPELLGKVTFLALLVPSRQGMAEYRAYEQRTRATIERINARFKSEILPGWEPIIACIGNDRARALACMRAYDVLMVNPLLDGMNLVVKEGALINQRDGVIVLSRVAGAYEQLREDVLGVPPLDVKAMAQALYRALTMPDTDRERHALNLRNLLEQEDAERWLGRQIHDTLAAPRQHVPAAAYRADEYAQPIDAAVSGEFPVLAGRHALRRMASRNPTEFSSEDSETVGEEARELALARMS